MTNSNGNLQKYRIRTAQLADIPEILAIFASEVEAGRMLPRTEEDMRASIQDWRVATVDNEIIGCVSLVFFTPRLCEIRSLAVAEPYRQNGLGNKLIQTAVELARQRGADDVLTLTRAPYLFEQLGFERSIISNFHHKVQQDCQLCPLVDNCDETALLYKISESVRA